MRVRLSRKNYDILLSIQYFLSLRDKKGMTARVLDTIYHLVQDLEGQWPDDFYHRILEENKKGTDFTLRKILLPDI